MKNFTLEYFTKPRGHLQSVCLNIPLEFIELGGYRSAIRTDYEYLIIKFLY
jgi:hypothetical protein